MIFNLISISDPIAFSRLAIALFLAILFLQSGIDKIIDWKGNLGWLKGHFEKSFLSGAVPALLFLLTLTEVLAGGASLLGAGLYLFTGETWLSMLGAQLSVLSLLMLFFGQRIAKDYPGAATLVPYFILSIIGILIQVDGLF